MTNTTTTTTTAGSDATGVQPAAVVAPTPPSAALQGSDTVLRVRDLGKEYRLYASPRQRLKSLLTGRAFHKSHWALRGVSFDLRRGQCIGVIGDNGAGKSSLLKLLAGTLLPTTGALERVGRVTAILELGAGFHPDFTGRDNLYFGGSLIGIDRETMARLEPGIIEFSELGAALDRPVKTYSSGMSVRLAFALVTAVQPDLLIIDEALAVGDQHFQNALDAFWRFAAAAAPSCFARTARTTSAICAIRRCGSTADGSSSSAPPSRCWVPTTCTPGCAMRRTNGCRRMPPRRRRARPHPRPPR